ncbi:MAG TPA: malic enzyme-like NAD(P)-binding protein [Anaerolineae bacterium]|nr:malic enzyme-like NAD(P)-binding protein [Anaerolineae bacterium]
MSTITIEEQEGIAYRRRHGGLIGVRSKVNVRDSQMLSLVYTPGVAEPCLDIARHPERSLDVTCRGNTIAIVSNGTTAFGLGDVGPRPILPVLESKAVIMKHFAGVDALPLAIDAPDVDSFVRTVMNLAPTFGAICIEDVASPMGMAITYQLERAMDIPVVNNHREGVAIGVLAGLLNAAKVVGKSLAEMKIVINGAGAAGLGTAAILYHYGARRVIVCDREGAITRYRPLGMNWAKAEIARYSNPEGMTGDLVEVLEGADVLVAFAGEVTAEHLEVMGVDPILFMFATPLTMTPDEAYELGAAVVATSSSDYGNQMDISVVVPGVFRGLLDVKARDFPVGAQIVAAEALAGTLGSDELAYDYIYPRMLDYRVAPAVAGAVAEKMGCLNHLPETRYRSADIAERTRRYIYEGRLPIPAKTMAKQSLAEEALELHDRFTGILEIYSKIPVKDERILKQSYVVPGAMTATKMILENPDELFALTPRQNLVGVVSDGSAVLGLGNIGARAALPVMEGKAVLFRTFAGVEAFPICVTTQDPDEIIDLVKRLEPTFGGINLEDISAPRCFYIEERLRAETDIPIFHDDQHGTAVVVLAGMLNACRLTGKTPAELRVVVNGAGASAIAVTKLLMAMGLEDVVLLDRRGAIYAGRAGMNWIKEDMAAITNRDKIQGDLETVVKGRDVFIGLSAPGVLTTEMVKTMAADPMIFALANPTPEIMPAEALAGGAHIVATGRSDLPNQVNNSLAFPGIFRGALAARVRNITDEMKIAAAKAIAAMVSDESLRPDWIIPKGTDFGVAPLVAEAVARTAVETGEARVEVDPAAVAAGVRQFVYEE